MKHTKVLVINGGDAFYNKIKVQLTSNRMICHHFSAQHANLPSITAYRPHIVIACSDNSGDISILNTIKKIRSDSPDIPVILVTLESSEALAIEALRAGVSDYFKNPIAWNDLKVSVEKNTDIINEKKNGHGDFDHKPVVPRELIAYSSDTMKSLISYLLKVSRTDTTVFITGETGTGKGLMAKLIHRYSHRKDHACIGVNCAALPENLIESELFGHRKGAFTGADTSREGKFLAASKGTLFLDEIGEMNLYAQAKILKSLENREIFPVGSEKPIPIDVRIVAATNQIPEKLIEEKKFRKDLYYRLNVARIHLPPLRERVEDIPDLIEYAIEKLNHRFGVNIKGVSSDALDYMEHHRWPGNIRELMNVMEAASINMQGEIITSADLPDYFMSQFKEKEKIPFGNEREKILSVLMQTKGNKKRAAEQLNCSRMTLYRKIRKYNIHSAASELV